MKVGAVGSSAHRIEILVDQQMAPAGASNTGTCPITNPCGSIGYALTQVTSGGVIHCVDSGDFTGELLTIAISVTIDCEQVHAELNAFVVNGSGITVVIRGGRIFGNDLAAIDFKNGAALIVERVELQGCDVAGILFAPTVNAQLRVTDSLIEANGTAGGTPGGIYIQPASGITADVTIDESRIVNNYFGIFADGTSGGTITATVRDSVVSGNTKVAIAAKSAGSAAWVLVD
jgi:hypothetical protein